MLSYVGKAVSAFIIKVAGKRFLLQSLVDSSFQKFKLALNPTYRTF